MKTKYFESEAEKEVMVSKLTSLTKEKATLLYEAIKADKPAARLLTEKCRNLTYLEIPLKCLEYLWTGCENADLKTRLKAKASYLVRVNEHNHPRAKLLFDLDENMKVLSKDEALILGRLYPEPSLL